MHVSQGHEFHPIQVPASQLRSNWHLKKSMGTVIRAMDRGIASANTMVKYVFLYLAPSE